MVQAEEALRAYYARRAMEDYSMANLFRKFGYHASADKVEARADRNAKRSGVEPHELGKIKVKA